MLVSIGVYFILQSDYTEPLQHVYTLFVSMCFVVYLVLFISKKNNYEYFSYKKQVIELSLNSSIQKQSECDVIIKEVIEWNIKLLKYKHQNKIFYFDDLIDDRIDDLDFIK